MILILHIVIALSSLAYTGYTLLGPTQTKLNVSYGFVAATLLSGTYLVVSTGGHLMQACATGLIYTGIVFYGIATARSRMLEARDRIRND